ncbi:uncharacterized protein BYT42DRAFT_580739 [Radiomyces spectabilis]|uniref:uncharacterized protein n=1 Tax=Radiomyces spectabilis TaxID=64574 RepID=UPI00221F68C0|nr:uncharacterized protein BYT42DRAFT_580739 [Radiomyces spectabilis]KAI8371570.1 hypothetical protein BYT42DRAFT_580739 [Radiomyces spectabilis]
MAMLYQPVTACYLFTHQPLFAFYPLFFLLTWLRFEPRGSIFACSSLLLLCTCFSFHLASGYSFECGLHR